MKRGQIVMLCGAGALILGAFLPWVKLSAPFVGTVTMAGTDNGGDGWLMVVAGVVIGALALTQKGPMAFIGSVVAVLTGLVLIYDGQDIAGRLADIDDDIATADFGAGFYLCAAGAIASLVGGIIGNNDAERDRAQAALEPASDE